jgi:hypothetical protein
VVLVASCCGVTGGPCATPLLPLCAYSAGLQGWGPGGRCTLCCRAAHEQFSVGLFGAQSQPGTQSQSAHDPLECPAMDATGSAAGGRGHWHGTLSPTHTAVPWTLETTSSAVSNTGSTVQPLHARPTGRVSAPACRTPGGASGGPRATGSAQRTELMRALPWQPVAQCPLMELEISGPLWYHTLQNSSSSSSSSTERCKMALGCRACAVLHVHCQRGPAAPHQGASERCREAAAAGQHPAGRRRHPALPQQQPLQRAHPPFPGLQVRALASPVARCGTLPLLSPPANAPSRKVYAVSGVAELGRCTSGCNK